MNEERDKERLKQFGAHLRALRHKLQLSQDNVVEKCDVTKGNLSMIENGNKDFNFTTLLEIAKGLEVEPKELLDFKI
ncbi:helix-turn-helix domain-containing protein [Mucilaginibacter sp. RCC_168]|uniref:helix-turn-helix domain-containing protein n=1 Tax=Mucilaginibacter sp. RCC_168 TaxID=3239221 RepID=UPI00352546F4